MKLIHHIQGVNDQGRPAISPEEVKVFSTLNAEYCAIPRRNTFLLFGPNQNSVELPHVKLFEGRDIYEGTFDGIPVKASIKNMTGILVFDLTPSQFIATDV